MEHHALLKKCFHTGTTVCIPEAIPTLKCKHGNYYDSRNPVKHGWVKEEQATLLLPDNVRKVCIYYRPVEGKKCDCEQYYQGGKHFIFNLNNKYLMTYHLLTHIHTQFLQSECTIDSITRSYNINNSLIGLNNVVNLRLFTNFLCSYMRLLNTSVLQAYSCKHCLEADKLIIHINGIQLGSNSQENTLFYSNTPIVSSLFDSNLHIKYM